MEVPYSGGLGLPLGAPWKVLAGFFCVLMFFLPGGGSVFPSRSGTRGVLTISITDEEWCWSNISDWKNALVVVGPEAQRFNCTGFTLTHCEAISWKYFRACMEQKAGTFTRLQFCSWPLPLFLKHVFPKANL